jgi:hypothetical protein
MSWLFVTAALGSANYTHAARRLVEQVDLLKVFDRCVIVDLELIQELWPAYSKRVPQKDWCAERNFGHYIWKPVIAQLATTGMFGNFEGVCYLDAGCEVLPSYFSRRSFIELIEKAESEGLVAFSTGAPEFQYTKGKVFDYFKSTDRFDRSPQLAAGSWFSFGPRGKNIINQWVSAAEFDYALINDEIEENNEFIEFQAPRHDQSLFSLTCKSNKIYPHSRRPPGSLNTIKSFAANFFFAFRWARNRTGRSANPIWLRKMGVFSLIFVSGRR